MGNNNLIFLENIEWLDDSGKALVHRVPQTGSAEIKWGAQLTVRESQAGVFFYKGKAVEAFSPGRHTLHTGNIPILNKIASIPWGMSSPLRAEVYFVNMKVFTNLTWGTRDPVAFKDSELGLIRLRAFGVFNLQILQPLLFINRMVGTQNMFTTETIEEYLNRVIVSRFNDFMGETIDSILNLPARYDELSGVLAQRLQHDFSHFGLGLTHLYINSVTPPAEVQQAIDDRSRMGAIADMGKLMQLKAAMAMEKAAQGDASGEGMGAGLGLMMPAMFAQFFAGNYPSMTPGPAPSSPNRAHPEPDAGLQFHCPDCKSPIAADAKFCPACGHQQLVFARCERCAKNLAPNARFCPRCGLQVEAKPASKTCPRCKTENLGDAKFCTQCGEKY